ncbi:MAG: GyrI-like domain-containing protein, partial [Fimbriimonadaceae bacterium]|nr:GyrI-like domain-containing protein [Fimbriimonadaceae bacterium]
PYHEIGHAFMKLGEKLGAHQIKPTGPMVGIYLDDPHSVAPADLRSFAAVPVEGTAEDPELEAIVVTGGRYAVWRYTGSYEHLGD